MRHYDGGPFTDQWQGEKTALDDFNISNPVGSRPDTAAGRALLIDLVEHVKALAPKESKQMYDATAIAIRVIEAEAREEGHRSGYLSRTEDERFERDREDRYSGIISIIEDATSKGIPLHVATRTTCAEHLERGDDLIMDDAPVLSADK